MSTGMLLMLLAWLPSAAVDAPLLGRPSDHFYGAVGDQVRISSDASRIEVRVEEEFTFTLRIDGTDNPANLQRPDLRQIEDFDSSFHIDDLDDGPELPANERYFRYRLRPKHERVKRIPALLYRYFQPKLHYFATTVSDELPLTVLPHQASDGTALPLDAPDFLFEVVTGSRVQKRHDNRMDWFWAALAWIGPLAACAVWYCWWRWRNPAAARLARLRRDRAVRHALDALAARDENIDRVVAAFRTYLQHRLDLTWRAQTMGDIDRELEAAGVAHSLRSQIGEFLSACDAGRFGPPGSNHADVRKLGRRLILHVEELP